MRAADLSLTTKCYRVDLDSITPVEIDSLIMCNNEKCVRVTFFGDKKLYFPKIYAKNIYKTIYFSKKEAEAAQKEMRLKALKKADEDLRKKKEKLLMMQKIYEGC